MRSKVCLYSAYILSNKAILHLICIDHVPNNIASVLSMFHCAGFSVRLQVSIYTAKVGPRREKNTNKEERRVERPVVVAMAVT